MAKPRRKRSDSAAAQTSLMRDALKGKEPPDYVEISKEERPFWDAIIAARADWTDVDLVHAAAMSRIQCLIEKESKLMAKEGCMIRKGNVTILNPRMKSLSALSRLSLDYSVKIQVHANATIGSVEAQLNKNQMKQQAIEAARNNAEELEDGLIARPKH